MYMHGSLLIYRLLREGWKAELECMGTCMTMIPVHISRVLVNRVIAILRCFAVVDDDVCCDRMCPLHVAVLQDNVELTSLLLQNGAQVDCADKRGLASLFPQLQQLSPVFRLFKTALSCLRHRCQTLFKTVPLKDNFRYRKQNITTKMLLQWRV